MKFSKIILFSTLNLLHVATWAQSSSPSDADEMPQEVVVAGVKDPAIKPYRQMLRGLEAFEKYRALAPQAPLRFKIVAASSSVSLADTQISITSSTVTIPLSVAPDGSFTLPRNDIAAAEDAELTLNKKKTDVRWRTNILTPGIEDKQPRLGDLRLACEVNWAILKDELPLVKRIVVNALGGPCRSSKINVYTQATRVIRSATLKEGDRQLILRLGKNGVSYNAPLADETWGNDAMIDLEYPESE
jgi:hypothetical protein